MSNRDRFEAEPLEAKLQCISDSIRDLADTQQGNSLALLSLLRTLEGLHQEIRDSLFQESLPDNRQALYSLLKDIEASGGWPYIHRMKLQSLLTHFQSASGGEIVPTIAGLSPVSTVDETLD